MSFSNIKLSREVINQNLQDMFSSFRDDSHIPDGFKRVNNPPGSPLIAQDIWMLNKDKQDIIGIVLQK